MALTAATTQAKLEAAVEAVTEAYNALWVYRSNCNNPALITLTDTICLDAITALTALRTA